MIRNVPKKKLRLVLPFFLLISLVIILSLLARNKVAFRTHAQSNEFLESENGVISGNIRIDSDSLASGGEYVHFAGSPYPQDTSLTSVSNPLLSRPSYLSPITDPIFSTQIMRIADQAAMGSTSQTLRHDYSKNQPWNSDETLLYLNYDYPAPLLDGKTYQFIRFVHEPSWSVWANTNPSITYGTESPNKFVYHDMIHDTQTAIYTFSQYSYLSIGEGEGNLSDDDSYVALFAKDSNNNQFVVLFNIGTKTPQTTIQLPNSSSAPLNWTSVDHDGKYILIGWDNGGTGRYQGVEEYDLTGTFLRQLSTAGGWHGDFGKDVQGKSVYVEASDCSTQSTSEPCSVSSQVSSYRLDGTGSYPVIARMISGKRYDNNLHVSGRNSKRPGWVYLSTFGPTDCSTLIDCDEIDAVKLDPNVSASNPVVERFAHEHHTISDYPAQPQAVPNHDGSRVIFASDWGGGSTVPIYSYVTAIPSSLYGR